MLVQRSKLTTKTFRIVDNGLVYSTKRWLEKMEYFMPFEELSSRRVEFTVFPKNPSSGRWPSLPSPPRSLWFPCSGKESNGRLARDWLVSGQRRSAASCAGCITTRTSA
ncbi:hypothetical protein N6H14_16815 [Paenibacillus sp. CC-CFT747]|nr:hypothetical protein N6H14_16815 [Paenibacillus sp. CC-CFT747]